MNNISICIPTYKRPVMLKQLILSITNCRIDETLIRDVDIIVVDNDSDKTAEQTVNELSIEFLAIHKLHYYNYPVKGLANVRNELLKNALELSPDFIVFIDDDEYVTTEWLNELVKSIINNNADAVRGPVLAEIDDLVPEKIACWFKRENYPDNYQLDSFATGNLILRQSSIKKYNVWFDKRFNNSGAEDLYFGIQLMKNGATIYWSAKAIVYETIPEYRATVKWLFMRSYRGASTYTYLLKLEREYLKLLKKITISLVYILLGCCSVILVPLPIKKRYFGIFMISEGLGGISGLSNILMKEYN